MEQYREDNVGAEKEEDLGIFGPPVDDHDLKRILAAVEAGAQAHDKRVLEERRRLWLRNTQPAAT
jgi:hypothetical protein